MQYDEQELSRAKPDHAHRFLRAHHGQRLFCQTGFQDTDLPISTCFSATCPDNGGFAIMAGRGAADRLSAKPDASPRRTSQYLRAKASLQRGHSWTICAIFHFTCDVWAVPEGTPIFPGEPIVTVRGPGHPGPVYRDHGAAYHQPPVASSPPRPTALSGPPQGRAVMEFGSRRAQGYDGAMYGRPGGLHRRLRAAPPAPWRTEMFGVPAVGTMAHSWVQMFATRVRGLQEPTAEIYPRQLHAAGGHLQRAEIRRAQRHQGLQRGAGAPGLPAQRASASTAATSPICPSKARKMLDDAGFDGLPDLRLQLPGRVHHPGHAAAGRQGGFLRRGRAAHHLLVASRCSAACTSWPPWRTRRGTSCPKSRSARTWPKSPRPALKRCGACLTGRPDKAIADVITLHDEVIDDEQALHHLRPRPHLEAQDRGELHRGAAAASPSSRAGSVSTPPGPSRPSGPTARPRWRRCGRKSPALRTPTTTTWTCLKSCGTKRTACFLKGPLDKKPFGPLQ